MLPVLAPIVMISVWGEGVEKAGGLVDAGAWGGWWPVAVHAVQFAGVAAILLFGSHVLRRVWHTERMPDSAVRDRLKAVCDRSRVRVRDLLLWRTGGTLHNAAVLGVLPPARFILVTDAMVESFPEELIEAVAAHEVGHVKRRHLMWLALATLAAILVVGMGSQYAAWHAARWAGLLDGPSAWRDALDGAAVTATLAGSLLWFGWVSRRFEWQADAFAAGDLARAGGEAESGRVTAEAAGRVMEALGLVAAYNGLAPTRFMWRHGSIRTRQRRLRELVGVPMAGLPIDREVARIKAVTVLGLVAAACIVVVESVRSA
jgi:Zn-dependent protease with chaperone function